MTASQKRIRKFSFIIQAYPIVLILISLGLNVYVFGVQPVAVAQPSFVVVFALAVSALLLVFNHTWLMTATELTRLRYNMYASHEEWGENDARKEDVAASGWIELDRHHSAHRNATENTVTFVLVALVFAAISPSVLAAEVWFVGFAVARLGYTYSALRGKSGLRGIFMSLSLLALYGLAGQLLMSFLLFDDRLRGFY
jgi:uncharacterized membrane protein YecN with MAPEG domain